MVMWVSLAGFLVLGTLVLFVQPWGMPNAVSCVEPETASHTPAMSVEVTSNRNGHIVERHALGCTFYFYGPPPSD